MPVIISQLVRRPTTVTTPASTSRCSAGGPPCAWMRAASITSSISACGAEFPFDVNLRDLFAAASRLAAAQFFAAISFSLALYRASLQPNFRGLHLENLVSYLT